MNRFAPFKLGNNYSVGTRIYYSHKEKKAQSKYSFTLNPLRVNEFTPRNLSTQRLRVAKKLLLFVALCVILK